MLDLYFGCHGLLTVKLTWGCSFDVMFDFWMDVLGLLNPICCICYVTKARSEGIVQLLRAEDISEDNS